MKAVCFLGTTDYRPVTYSFNHAECRTEYFPVAVCQFFHPDELLVLMTDAAQAVHLDRLQAQLSQRATVRFRPVPIPEGKNEDEIWQLFDTLIGAFEEGDKVLLDITLGYRSLPVLGIIAAAYLRVARNVEIHKIVYGALEARSKRDDHEELVPVFDLSSFLTLLDWTTATDKFLKTGNAGELAGLLKEAHDLPYQPPPQARTDLPRRLKNVADAMGRVSQAMRLTRSLEVIEHATDVDTKLQAARADAERWAKPFAILLDKTHEAYAQFVAGDPNGGTLAVLQAELKLINWYREKGQYVQAITLAREWLVSLTAFRVRWDLIRDREIVETVLGQAQKARKDNKVLPTLLQSVPRIEKLLDDWNQLQDLRNDVAHCGKRLEPRPVKAIIETADRVCPGLVELLPEVAES